MKRLMLYMSDSLPMYTLDWPWVDYNKYAIIGYNYISCSIGRCNYMYNMQVHVSA